MKTNDIIKTNRKLQQQLTEENNAYYGDLLVYLRARGAMKKEAVIEEKALEILTDILDAQRDGISAETYFGKEPQEIANDLLSFSPISLMDFLKLALIALGSYSLFSILPALIFPENDIDFGSFMVVGLYSFISAITLFWLISKGVYAKKKKQSNILLGILGTLLFFGGILLAIFIKTPLTVELPGPVGILTILTLLIVMSILFFTQNNEDKQIWSTFIPLILVCATIGILSRISYFSEYFETTMGKYIVVAILLISAIFQYLIVYLQTKKMKNIP